MYTMRAHKQAMCMLLTYYNVHNYISAKLSQMFNKHETECPFRVASTDGCLHTMSAHRHAMWMHVHSHMLHACAHTKYFFVGASLILSPLVIPNCQKITFHWDDIWFVIWDPELHAHFYLLYMHTCTCTIMYNINELRSPI